MKSTRMSFETCKKRQGKHLIKYFDLHYCDSQIVDGQSLERDMMLNNGKFVSLVGRFIDQKLAL